MVAFSSSIQQALNRIGVGLYSWIWGDLESDTRMTADRAISYPPVWNCVSTISGAFMIMPLNVKRRIGDNIKDQTRHASYMLWRWRPNAYQTPSQFKRQMICHLLLWGNARAYIRRENGTPVELIPLMPDRSATIMVDGEKYQATIIDRDDRLSLWQDMTQNIQKTLVFPDADVWHVPGLGFNGIEGKSLISVASQSWGIGLGAEKHIAAQQKKGYAGGLMLEAPVGSFTREDDAKEFLKNFREAHEGSDNTGKIGMLRQGIKANVLAMNNQDAQFVEERRFQREDAAMWFLLQGIIGDSSGNSYASLEQKNLAYRINCLGPWTTAIEEESDLKLLTDSERNREFYHKFNDGALMRTEKDKTMLFVSQGITARVLSPNEGREMFDLNPYEGGDEYANPAISPGKPGQPPASELATQQANKKMKSVVLIDAEKRYERLIGIESATVIRSAKTAMEKRKNFVEWIEEWYEGGWYFKLASGLNEAGINKTTARKISRSHCQTSKAELLAVCGYSTSETLVENVRNCVKNWKERTKTLGDLQNV